MSLGVFLAVLGAAFLHALWNALVKVGAAKLTSMLILTLVQGGIGVLAALALPLPQGAVWLWLLAAGALHTAYKLFLGYAYEQGDLSRVYPIARGAAPMMVLAISVLFLAEPIAASGYAAVLLLGTGVLLMARGALRSGESRRLVPLALGSAAATAGYSLVDGLGARAAGDAAMFVAWLFVLDALFFSAAILSLRGRAVLLAPPRTWAMGALAGAASYAAYAIAVWAMTQAPIAMVTALRETSILFAMLIGVVVFGERLTRDKAAAGALILCGVMLMRL